MARAPVSKTGGWGFESLHSCQVGRQPSDFPPISLRWINWVGQSMRRGSYAAGSPREFRDLKKFVRVLEQRKPRGVPRRSERHFLRPLDPQHGPDANLP